MKKEILRYKEIDYVIRYPEGFLEDSEKKYPLLFYIHGSGGRGRDIERMMEHPFFQETDPLQLPAVSVVPQCYEDSWFSIFEQLQEFLRFHMDQAYIDRDRVYVMGSSMGGYTTWQLAMSRPEWFAAIVPICGGGMYWNAERLRDVPVWAFHGAKDGVVRLEESVKMTEAVNACGGNARLTVYPQREHDAWTDTYSNPEVFRWLLSCVKGTE